MRPLLRLPYPRRIQAFSGLDNEKAIHVLGGVTTQLIVQKMELSAVEKKWIFKVLATQPGVLLEKFSSDRENGEA